MTEALPSAAALPSMPATVVAGPSVRRLMGLVLLALLPGVLAQIARFGIDLAFRLLLAIACALAVEALALLWRRRALRPFLTDLSAPVAAVLVVLVLPFAIPWWLACIGIIAALVVGKHMYGGLGDNPFNPAMLGCALLLAGFTAYLPAVPAAGDTSNVLRWAPMMYALGGLFLLWKRIIRWHAPAAMLAGALATQFLHSWLAEADFKGADLFASLSAPIVLCAFFIVTDPVTGCLSARGRLYFGAGAGVLTVLLSRSGNAATGMPFAVLVMNCAAPWIDTHTRPRLPKPVPA